MFILEFFNKKRKTSLIRFLVIVFSAKIQIIAMLFPIVIPILIRNLFFDQKGVKEGNYVRRNIKHWCYPAFRLSFQNA
jgi:hypothetical protein